MLKLSRIFFIYYWFCVFRNLENKANKKKRFLRGLYKMLIIGFLRDNGVKISYWIQIMPTHFHLYHY